MRATVTNRETAREPARTPAERPARRPQVQSVAAAVQILQGIADNDGSVRVNELARQLGMTRARVSRHLQTLLGLGLVARGSTEGYGFGTTLMQLARAAVRDRTLVELAGPHLLALRDAVEHTVILSVPAPDGAVVVSSVSSRETAAVTVKVAGFLSLPASPAARLCVALRPRGPRARVPAAATLKHWPAFGAEYELDTGRGVGGVAAPVLDDAGHALAAVSVVAPASSLRPRPGTAMVAALGQCVRAIAATWPH